MKKKIKLNCILAHTGVLAPDRHPSHVLVQINVSPGTTMTEIRRRIRHQLDNGEVESCLAITRDDSGEEGDAWYKAAHAAVERDVRLPPGFRTIFKDVDLNLVDGEPVKAFFVFKNAE